MKIAFYLENRNIPDVDFRNPKSGNPGCGATEFLFAALPCYLATRGGCRPVILANHIDTLPQNVPRLRVRDLLHAGRRAKEEGCDLLVHRLRRHPEPEFLELLESLQLPVITWAQLHPTGPQARALAHSEWVKAVVCVGREQHDSLRDTPMWRKLSCIVNPIDLNGYRLAKSPATEHGLVVYLGALVPQKGFHLLAQAWREVLRRCPEARLAVIGSGKLYNGGAELGPWGVASPAYEHRLMPYLAGANGRLHPSVTFLGKLGLEKKEMLYRAAVGVVNPSGQTETCPVSALEFQACGTPVVSGAYYGMLDTVCHGYTGLLGRSASDLAANICSLLKNPSKAETLGRNGGRFVEDLHDFETVADEWYNLIKCLTQGLPIPKIPSKRNYHRHQKFLVGINRPFQMTLGHIVTWPSVMEMKSFVAGLPRIRTLMTSEGQ